MYSYCVYILCNRTYNVFYCGVTRDLHKRVYQHKEGYHLNSFSKRYRVDRLVYYETFPLMMEAVEREKQIKAGRRKAKIKLIESMNPNYDDLAEEWY